MINLAVTLILLGSSTFSLCYHHNHIHHTPSLPQIKGSMFLFGDGSVPVSNTSNPFANNALDGRSFLVHEMGFSVSEIQRQRRLALAFWFSKFGVDGEALERAGNASIREYQINPLVNERAYQISLSCITPAVDYKVLDGGFQLLITAPDGVEGIDPFTGRRVVFPFFTNLVYAWLRVKDCLREDIVLPYRSSSLVEFVLKTIVFELNITRHEKNPLGEGRLLGLSAPIVKGDIITNRLLNYITFDSV